MRVELRTLLGQTAVYGFGGAIGQAVGIITLPIFARALDASEYGVFELYTVGMAVAVVLADLGLGAAAQRFYYDYHEHDVAARRSVVTTAFLASLVLSTVIAAVIYGCREPLASWLFDGEASATVVTIAAITLPLVVVASMAREIMRLTLQPWRYLASNLIAAFAGSALGVLAVTTFDAGVEGILIAGAIAAALSAAYGLVVARSYLRGHFDWHRLRRMLGYGLPLLPGLAALWITSYADRLLLADIEDLDAVGLYAIASRFVSPVLLLMVAFVTAYAPFLLSLNLEKPALERELRGRVATLATVGLLTAGLPIVLYGPELIDLVAPGYDGAADAMAPLVLGATAFGLSAVFGAPMMIHRRTDISALMTIIMAVGNVALCLVLIPPFGLVGAAIASFGGYALLAFLYWWWGRRVDDAPYELRSLVLAFVIAAIAMQAWRIDLDSGALTLLVKLAVWGAFVIALRLAHVVAPADLGALREIVETRWRATRSADEQTPG